MGTHDNRMTIKLPNGLVGKGTGEDAIRSVVIRELDGDDEDMLRNEDNLTEGNVLNDLLKRVIVKVGEEENEKEIAKIFEKQLLMADMTFILIKMRIWGIDPIYKFDYSCPKCGKISRHKLDLRELVEDEQHEDFRGLEKGITIEHKGVVIAFKQLMAERDTMLLRTINEDYPREKATRELLMQMQEVDGVQMNAPLAKKLSWKKRQAVRQAMDKAIGGIDTELEMRCRRCRATFKDNMPIHLKDFFFPMEEEFECQTARPFRVSGIIRSSSEPDGIGDPETSDNLASENAPSMSSA